ncbi:MAG: DUF4363 family protein [Clostridia bacterium]|nr:DUF4363 family protein [Clostridia bacterium]
MRAFIITVILLAVLLGTVTVNHVYIKEVFHNMETALDELPDVLASDCLEKTLALENYWEKQVDPVSLSVSYTIVDRICEHAATLVACAECGDLYGYRTALALLRDAIGDMMRFETPSIGALL